MKDRIVLEGQGLGKRFPVRSGVFMRTGRWLSALEGVNFSLPEGQTLGIVGESGCGKTTLGKVVARLHEGEGSLIYHARDGRRLQLSGPLPRKSELEYRRDVQMVFQDPFGSLDPRMTVEAVLREPLEAHGLALYGRSGRQKTRAVLESLAARVGLHADSLDRFPHEFSGGQRQRIAIARALTLEPRVVICDEPTSALDVSVQSQVVNLLCSIQKETGISYLFISHNLELVRHMADKIVVMYLGRAVEEGPAAELFASPAHPYTVALLAATPSWDPENHRALAARLAGEPPSPLSVPPGCPFAPRCPRARDLCRADPRPEFRRISEGRLAACHFA